jgi:hypothetical protein
MRAASGVLLGGTAEDYGYRRSGRAGGWVAEEEAAPRSSPDPKDPQRGLGPMLASDACVRARLHRSRGEQPSSRVRFEGVERLHGQPTDSPCAKIRPVPACAAA